MTEDNRRGADGNEIALEADRQDGAKRHSPSVARNREPILAAFRKYMPQTGLFLEIASGTGEHGAYISSEMPEIEWLPSDPDEACRESIAAWGEDVPGGRMRLPLAINVMDYGWWDSEDITGVNGMVCINMLHITPIEAAQGLFRGAAGILAVGQRLFLYGPFSRKGEMVESNSRFDADLKRRNANWGVRDLEDEIVPLGSHHALHLVAVEEMPANNLVVVFEKG